MTERKLKTLCNFVNTEVHFPRCQNQMYEDSSNCTKHGQNHTQYTGYARNTSRTRPQNTRVKTMLLNEVIIQQPPQFGNIIISKQVRHTMKASHTTTLKGVRKPSGHPACVRQVVVVARHKNRKVL